MFFPGGGGKITKMCFVQTQGVFTYHTFKRNAIKILRQTEHFTVTVISGDSTASCEVFIYMRKSEPHLIILAENCKNSC